MARLMLLFNPESSCFGLRSTGTTHVLVKPIQILQLEDSSADAALLKATLETEGVECHIRCVQTKDDFRAALQTGQFDLIISDHALPSFDGLAALALAKTAAPEVPFIFVSGTIQEEAAIESLKQGATDYVLKDRPRRLVSAVRRAVAEGREQAGKKKLEAQLYRAQRMESIGALAGGIAHDLNNMLVPILMASEMLDADLAAEQRAQLIATIRCSAQRASEMVRRILLFARGTVGQSHTIQPNELIAEIVKLGQSTFLKSVQIKTNVTPGLPPIIGNTTQLHQVLMNLCMNARDAMPEGGTITLGAEPVTLLEHSARGEAHSISGSFVEISVTDTGHGMSPDILEKIFEPFFTTKAEGAGTGLGLPTLLGIVKNHGGHVEVLSEPGQGTTFKVYLPVASAPEAGKEFPAGGA
jgi:signal transduction histidine kinase